MNHHLSKILLTPLTALLIYGCSGKEGILELPAEKLPEIEPDYSGIVIPPNIAPLNFIIKEEGTCFFTTFSVEGKKPFTVKSRRNVIIIPQKKWRNLLEGSAGKIMNIDIAVKDKTGIRKKFSTITNLIAAEPVDPYLTYRVIYPGYERWNEISICQRELASFKVTTLINNYAAEENCVNCHSFNNGKSDDFLFHMRGSLGGTFFYSEGKLVKYNLKTPEMKNGAVYPRWHPSGRYVAFSSNKIVQRFHVLENKRIEVSDLESSLVLFDRQKNEIMPIPLEMDSLSMDTYPEWSPDGRILYFCRAPKIGEMYDYQKIRYDLWKVSFNPDTREFGKEDIFFRASDKGKSIAFPRISPDGKYIIVTISNYGCFPIWHPEADLYAINVETGNAERLNLNSSSSTDSYHSWSSNGKWILFATRRDNGLMTKPYIAYFNNNGQTSKPFALPQKNPVREHYNTKSYNLPEFSIIRINTTPGKIRKFSRLKPLEVKWAGN